MTIAQYEQWKGHIQSIRQYITRANNTELTKVFSFLEVTPSDIRMALDVLSEYMLEETLKKIEFKPKKK